GAVAGAEIPEEAVARVEAAGDTECHVLRNRSGDVRLTDEGIVIAVSQLGRTTEVERGPLRRNRDDAGGGVLTEQSRLRTAQNFDPLHVGQVGDLRRGARAIDAVDEHADRRLDAGVV